MIEVNHALHEQSLLFEMYRGNIAKVAARCMVGTSLAAQNMTKELIPPFFSVKESVFPLQNSQVSTQSGSQVKSSVKSWELVTVLMRPCQGA